MALRRAISAGWQWRRTPEGKAFIALLSLTLLFFLPILLLVLSGIVKDKSPQMLFLGAALTSVAFFVLMTLQRERYLYPSVALSLVAALYAHKNWSYYIVSSITLFLDMFIVLLIIAPSNFGLDQHFAYQWSAVIAGGAVLLSLTNIWLLGRMFTTYLLHVRHAFRAMRYDFLKGSIPEAFSP